MRGIFKYKVLIILSINYHPFIKKNFPKIKKIMKLYFKIFKKTKK